MTAEQVIRNINLSILSDIELEEPYLSLYEFLNKTFGNLRIYHNSEPNLSNIVYYGKNKREIFIRYEKDTVTYINHAVYKKIDIAFQDINSSDEFEYKMLKYYLESHLNVQINILQELFMETSSNLRKNIYLVK